MIINDCKYRCTGKDPLLNSKHFHSDTIELLQIFTNDGNVLINNELYPMVSGAVYFIDSENLHCTIPKNEKNYCRNKIILSKSKFKKALSYLGGSELLNSLIKQGIFILDTKTQHTIENLYLDIATEYLTDKLNSSFAILKMCLMLYNNPVKGEATQNALIEKALQYINSNFEKNIKIADICKSLYVSESYLCHTFKKEVNMTVKEYILKQQIIKALYLLENTNASLESIAQDCGFSSHSQFSKRFKSEVKCSPKSYRINFKSKNLSYK